jgi:hypothetical protein
MNIKSIVTCDLRGDWRKFAKELFRLEDADPGYCLLKRAKLHYAQKLRYVLAWCTFYNPGIAAIASQYEGAQFYEYLRSQYPTAKRASERRHFRGQAGLKALAQWQELYPKPEYMVEDCYARTYLGVRQNMKHMAQMGDYFYWKLADVWDTVFDKPVDFKGCEQYMPKVPQQGSQIISALETPIKEIAPDLVEIMGVITKHVQKIPYHVKGVRKLALQEAETVCCVFKQHYVGDYRLGYRTAKAETRLLAVEQTPTVKALLDGIYDGEVWTPETLLEVRHHMLGVA